MTPVLFGINTNDAGGLIIGKRTGKCSIFLSTNDGDKVNYNHESMTRLIFNAPEKPHKARMK